MISPGDLHKVWAAPDNTRLTSRQFSFRLPVHVAAKLSALCELFPEKTRTQIVGDLLATAIDDFARSFPVVKGDLLCIDPSSGEEIYDEDGQGKEYQKLADHYYRELEIEMGNENPKSLFVRSAAAKEESD